MKAIRPLLSGRGLQTGIDVFTEEPKKPTMRGLSAAPSQEFVGRVADGSPGSYGLMSVSSAVMTSVLRLQRLNVRKPLASANGQRSLLRFAVIGNLVPSGPIIHRLLARRAWPRPRSGLRVEAKTTEPSRNSHGST